MHDTYIFFWRVTSIKRYLTVEILVSEILQQKNKVERNRLQLIIGQDNS